MTQFIASHQCGTAALLLGKLLLRLFGAENQLQAVRFSAPKWSLNLTTRRITPCEGFPRTGCCAQALSFYLHIQPKTNTWNISCIHLLSTHVWKSGKDWTCMNMSCIHIPDTYKSKTGPTKPAMIASAAPSLPFFPLMRFLAFLWRKRSKTA